MFHKKFLASSLLLLCSIPVSLAQQLSAPTSTVDTCTYYAQLENSDVVGEDTFTTLTVPKANKAFFTTCWDSMTRTYERQSLPGFYGYLSSSKDQLEKISNLPSLSTGEKAIFFQHLLLSQRNTVDIDHVIPLYISHVLAVHAQDDPELVAQIAPLDTLSPTYAALKDETKISLEKQILVDPTTSTADESLLLELQGVLAVESGKYSSFIKKIDLRKTYSENIKALFSISLLGEGKWIQAKPRILDALKASHTLQQGLRMPTNIDKNFGFQENIFTTYSKEEQTAGIIQLFTQLGVINQTDTNLEAPISRASTLKLVFDLFYGKELVASYFSSHKDLIASYHMEQYGETLSLDQWFTPYALFGLEHGLLKKGQALHLGDAVSKAEVLTILTRSVNLPSIVSTALPETKGTWFSEYVDKINALPKNVNVLEEIQGSVFEPAQKAEVLRWCYIFLPEGKK